ncbi:MAG: peptide-methionine (S)-S-oxide reductase [Desulfobacteraceae bacterium]|nr:peptide-methionine (S)-S-oxide reductase [Desulfobacteraceae bacterium]
MEAQFGLIDGVIRTRVGYAGGQMSDPDYRHMGDHTETVQIDYDPLRISYAELLNVFWESHKPTEGSGSRQYMKAVFYHDERQRALADASKSAMEQKTGRSVTTEVLPVRTFYWAEDYHQKYLLKRRTDLTREMTRMYPLEKDFLNSTAVARLNGYAGGYGRPDQLAAEITDLGLSPAGRQSLDHLVGRSGLFN